MNTAFVNGAFPDISEARISVLDRGFLFADAVYEVIPVYGGLFFLLEPHLARLENSLRAALIPNPHDRDEWTGLLRELVHCNGAGDMAVYVQVTRGTQSKRNHELPESPQPGVVAFCQPLPAIDEQVMTEGIAAVTRPDPRWEHCHIKSTALLPNVLARHEATRENASEALLIRDGDVMEGSASNIFMAFGGVVTTPPEQRHLLSGITRQLVLRLAGENGLNVRERNIPAGDLPHAEELWLTSSTRELIPVTRLDGNPVGSGRPGRLWRQLSDLVLKHKHAFTNQPSPSA